MSKLSELANDMMIHCAQLDAIRLFGDRISEAFEAGEDAYVIALTSPVLTTPQLLITEHKTAIDESCVELTATSACSLFIRLTQHMEKLDKWWTLRELAQKTDGLNVYYRATYRPVCDEDDWLPDVELAVRGRRGNTDLSQEWGPITTIPEDLLPQISTSQENAN